MTEAEYNILTSRLTPLGQEYLSEISSGVWVVYNNYGFCGLYGTPRMFTHMSRTEAVKDIEVFHKIDKKAIPLRRVGIDRYELEIIDPDEPSVRYYYTVEKINSRNKNKFAALALAELATCPHCCINSQPETVI